MMTDRQKIILKEEMKKRFPSFFSKLTHKLKQEKNRSDRAVKTKKIIDDEGN